MYSDCKHHTEKLNGTFYFDSDHQLCGKLVLNQRSLPLFSRHFLLSSSNGALPVDRKFFWRRPKPRPPFPSFTRNLGRREQSVPTSDLHVNKQSARSRNRSSLSIYQQFSSEISAMPVIIKLHNILQSTWDNIRDAPLRHEINRKSPTGKKKVLLFTPHWKSFRE